jgi:hypothetical protein
MFSVARTSVGVSRYGGVRGQEDWSSSAHARCRRRQAWNRLGDTRRKPQDRLQSVRGDGSAAQSDGVERRVPNDVSASDFSEFLHWIIGVPIRPCFLVKSGMACLGANYHRDVPGDPRQFPIRG